ncbi:cystathionine beta-lyase [Ruegeria profundi]|uniref:cystathionine beta-lyase n=1 Tax=Ruegeria profundi TaxID=1685378 RepID=UPI001CD247B5|nr:cystathionine beta-lyase [Ruegeria profundi]MCA0928045.1 cystathionine beta-lyase [Ruegeria profundi]
MDDATRMVHAAKAKGNSPHAVNPPVVRASTVLFPDITTMRDYRQRRTTGERLFSYGARGTPSSMALEDALCELEQGDRAFLYPSGLAALGAVFLAYTRPGDHVAIIDTAYPPVRRLAENYFKPRGVEVSFFPPETEALRDVMRPNTRLVLAECPGSNSFDMIDVPAMAAIARKHGALLAVDNTWSAGVFFKPLQHGADISIQAATKYICGHSDVMMGAVVTREAAYRPIFDLNSDFGICVSPDDCYTALRGLRSLKSRLETHERSALKIARWLEQRSDVATVLHPALESFAGHELWQRDFTGSSGLFAFRLAAPLNKRSDEFVDALSLFGIGASWGGYESLALPLSLGSTTLSTADEVVIRLHIGLESVDDLIQDIASAFGTIGRDGVTGAT